ncbi:MAG TPA: hypothetical protein VFI65_08170 [Streptosporangiaceae bacterium]|nr:hypothetical protein [Streptosporangiaceae bacterium]
MAELSLDEAAEQLYDAFGEVPRPQRIVGCPHCVEPGEDLPLVSRPLRELSAEDLSRYAFKAMSTWGTEADFRYFAPRVLDLTVSGAMDWPGFEVVCGKLDQAGLRAWSQRPAVEEFLRAFWTTTLHRFPASLPVSEAMWGVATVARDLSPYLADWERLATAASIRVVTPDRPASSCDGSRHRIRCAAWPVADCGCRGRRHCPRPSDRRRRDP